MKISIITTFYNSSEYISECINSVQNIHSEHDVEHILVNDGSTDNTLDIITTLKYKNVRVIGKNHIGRGPALNLGLENATGYYICILDSDDLINSKWIDFFLKNYSKYDRAGIFFGQITTNMNIYKSYKPPSLISQKILNPSKILFYNPICHSGAIFKRNTAIHINGYSTSLKSQFDWDLWLRLSFINENFVKINYLTAFKRLHPNQSFESKKHFFYTINGAALQLKAVMSIKPVYFVPVFIFAILRIIWSFFPRKLRTSRLFDMLR